MTWCWLCISCAKFVKPTSAMCDVGFLQGTTVYAEPTSYDITCHSLPRREELGERAGIIPVREQAASASLMSIRGGRKGGRGASSVNEALCTQLNRRWKYRNLRFHQVRSKHCIRR